jgi:8-oxo-dGTP pyrophosphatase MutT (NUDIX family)
VPVRRLGYRLAYRLLRVWWALTRPRVSGVKCLLRHDDRILLVRHTYGPRGWDLPGGMVKRGEDPQLTARREMGEELGVSAETWIDLGVMVGSHDHRHDTIHLYGAELSGPAITIDLGELSVAQWYAPAQLPAGMRPLGAEILRHVLPLVSG